MIKYFLELNPSSFIIWDEEKQDVVYKQQIVMLSENLSLVYKEGKEVQVDGEVAVNLRNKWTSIPIKVTESLYNREGDPIKDELFSALIHGINTKNGRRYSHD